MGTWTAFYINTSEQEQVIEKLKELSGVENETVVKIPDYSFSYILDEPAFPNYIIIGKTQDNWIIVEHNSLSKLEEWGHELSKYFDCKVIIALAQTSSDVYYFALYDKSQKRREIEVCYSDDSFQSINFGDRFDFENEQPGEKQNFDGDDEYYFGYETIQEYCKHFGLDISTEEDHKIEWTILAGKPRKTVDDLVKENLKPRWKFW